MSRSNRQTHVDPLPHLEAVARAIAESGQPEPVARLFAALAAAPLLEVTNG